MAMILGGGSMLDPVASVWNQMDQLLHAIDKQMTPQRAFVEDAKAIANTRVDWMENPQAHVVNVELPGLNKEDIKVQLEDNNVLTISGERKREEMKKDEKWHVVERSYGKFLRRFKLPDNVKADEITAKVENGVLCVQIPKTKTEGTQPKPIDVGSDKQQTSPPGEGTQATSAYDF